MAMLKELFLHIRYPYTCGVIATMWLGTAALAAIGNDSANVSDMVGVLVVATTIIAIVGFSSARK
jgi:hypothetical protein